MKILFNPFTGNFEIAPTIIVQTQQIVSGALLFEEGDLNLDSGDRTNENSLVDNGDRVIEVLT